MGVAVEQAGRILERHSHRVFSINAGGADAPATALIAGGQATLDHVTDRFRIAVLVQRADGALLANPAFRALIARSPDI